MAPDERSRVEASQALSDQLGPAAAAALMECIPPFGWHEIATKRDLDELERRIDLRFDAVDLRFDAVEARFESIEARFESIEARFESIEARFESIEARFESIDARFQAMEVSLLGVQGQLQGALHAEATRMIKWTVGAVFGGITAVCVAATTIAALLG